MGELALKHYRDRDDERRAFCGVTVNRNRDIPEMAGMCPTCVEVLIGYMHDENVQINHLLNTVISMTGNFGAALTGYINGLRDGDSKDEHVEEVGRQFDKTWNEVRAIVKKANQVDEAAEKKLSSDG